VVAVLEELRYWLCVQPGVAELVLIVMYCAEEGDGFVSNLMLGATYSLPSWVEDGRWLEIVGCLCSALPKPRRLTHTSSSVFIVIAVCE
jgi:hypothetical protein